MPNLGRAWTLWLAAALAVVGGVAPFVFGGTSSRIDGVIIPFWIGAALFAFCAFQPNQGRALIALLYFVGAVAIVYGLLSMFSLPVRLAILGTCPAPPVKCATGLPAPLTNGENDGMGIAAGFGIAAILLGFFGLVIVYRRTVVEPVMAPAPASVAAAAEVPAAAPEQEPELPAHEEEDLPETREAAPPEESTPGTT